MNRYIPIIRFFLPLIVAVIFIAGLTDTGSISKVVGATTLFVQQGGTSASTLTGILIGNGTSAFTGTVLTANQSIRRNAGNTAYEGFTAFGGVAGTINEIAYFDSATSIASLAVATYPSLTQLSYVKGVTSAIQTQFTGKAAVDQTMYIGTTAHAINRASASEGLAGITSLTPGADFTLSQNSVAPFTSVNSGAIVNTLYLKAGNVGIGTTNPLQKLHVAGDDAKIIVQDTTQDDSANAINGEFAFGYPPDASLLLGGMRLLRGTAAGNGYNGFATVLTGILDGGSMTNVLYAGGNGNVGIGDTNPGAVLTVKTASASAFAVGLNGNTNPALLIDASTASSANGLQIKSSAATNKIALSAISSNANEGITLDTKGTGTLTIQATGTGSVGYGSTPNARVFIGYGGLGDHAWVPTIATTTNSVSYVAYRPASITMKTSGDTGNMSLLWLGATTLNHAGADTSALGTNLYIDAPAIGASGSFTTMTSVYISGVPTGGTTNYAIWIDAGNIRQDGSMSIGTGAVPTSLLTLGAGTATASTAPLKFNSGTNLTTPEAGAMEYNGTNLFFTNSAATRATVQTSKELQSGQCTLDGGATATCTLAIVYTSATSYVCTTSPQTNTNSLKVTRTSSTVVTITSAVTLDTGVVNVICHGS